MKLLSFLLCLLFCCAYIHQCIIDENVLIVLGCFIIILFLVVLWQFWKKIVLDGWQIDRKIKLSVIACLMIACLILIPYSSSVVKNLLNFLLIANICALITNAISLFDEIKIKKQISDDFELHRSRMMDNNNYDNEDVEYNSEKNSNDDTTVGETIQRDEQHWRKEEAKWRYEAENARRQAEEAKRRADEEKNKRQKEATRRRAEQEQQSRKEEYSKLQNKNFINSIQKAFDLFELPYNSTFDEVKRKRTFLLKFFHPDHHQEDKDTEYFATKKAREINAAYKILELFFKMKK